MYSLELYSSLVRMTRIMSQRRTLIYNIYTSQINDILNSDDISNHLPIFTFSDLNNIPISKQPQFRYNWRFNDMIKQRLFEEFNTIDWNCILKYKNSRHCL